MRKSLIMSFAALFCAVLTLCASPLKKTDLKILYVGGTSDWDNISNPQDPKVYAEQVKERMASFEEYLKEYFTSVTVVNAADYKQEMSYKYDVTIMDGKPNPIVPLVTDSQHGEYMRPTCFTEDFDRPIITLAEMGETVGRRIGIKNDWFCLCLDNYAYGWKKNHPIFQGPYKADLKVEVRKTPDGVYGPKEKTVSVEMKAAKEE